MFDNLLYLDTSMTNVIVLTSGLFITNTINRRDKFIIRHGILRLFSLYLICIYVYTVYNVHLNLIVIYKYSNITDYFSNIIYIGYMKASEPKWVNPNDI